LPDTEFLRAGSHVLMIMPGLPEMTFAHNDSINGSGRACTPPDYPINALIAVIRLPQRKFWAAAKAKLD
jgi:hypothetical protein